MDNSGGPRANGRPPKFTDFTVGPPKPLNVNLRVVPISPQKCSATFPKILLLEPNDAERCVYLYEVIEEPLTDDNPVTGGV